MNKLRNKKNKGFSLVELIIVIAIMAILAGILIPQFVRYVGNSRVSSDIQQAENIYNAVAARYADDAVSGGSPSLTYDSMVEITAAVAGTLDMGSTAPSVKVDSNFKFYYYCTSAGAVSVYVGPSTGATTTNSTRLSPDISGPDATKWQ